jgi:hypothetical protein
VGVGIVDDATFDVGHDPVSHGSDHGDDGCDLFAQVGRTEA